jgi:hypothetical protein
MSHCLSGRPGGLGVPEVEATDVKLHGLLVCPDALYHELAALNGRVTGEAHLAMAGAAPDLREALLRQASIGELFSNEMTDAFEFQGGPPGNATAANARFTVSQRFASVNPKGQGAGVVSVAVGL